MHGDKFSVITLQTYFLVGEEMWVDLWVTSVNSDSKFSINVSVIQKIKYEN